MLFYNTIDPKTLQLLIDLQESSYLKDFILVGGTSLALQIGHRISIDLDLFTETDFDVSLIPEHITKYGEVTITHQSPSILNTYISNVKVDFVSYRYKFIDPTHPKDDIRLASITDIAAMKLAAITGRGSKKDFIDLYFILKQYSLSEIFTFYNKKYPDGSDFLVFKSLTYFEDADLEPMPRMLKQVEWLEVKNKIIIEVKKHFP